MDMLLWNSGRVKMGSKFWKHLIFLFFSLLFGVREGEERDCDLMQLAQWWGPFKPQLIRDRAFCSPPAIVLHACPVLRSCTDWIHHSILFQHSPECCLPLLHWQLLYKQAILSLDEMNKLMALKSSGLKIKNSLNHYLCHLTLRNLLPNWFL